jgi:Tfp pilus assembly pilus retraction ATPase PilT
LVLAVSDKPDVIFVGELSEWETAEYISDEHLLGANTSLIILGHALSEEPGMEYFVDWLQPKLTDVKVTHISNPAIRLPGFSTSFFTPSFVAFAPVIQLNSRVYLYNHILN